MDLGDGTEPVDKQNMLVASHPSSSNNGLDMLEVSCQAYEYRRRTETTPHITIVAVQLEYALEVLNSFVELFLCAKDTTDGIHGGNGSLISV